MEFEKYRRTQISEIRRVTQSDIDTYNKQGKIVIPQDNLGEWKTPNKVSISDEDLKNGSPKLGDRIARNPLNHNDQWLIAERYFYDNFEPLNVAKGSEY